MQTARVNFTSVELILAMVHVPTAEAEAERHVSRDRGQLLKEVGQHRDRLLKLLRTVGVWQTLDDAQLVRLLNNQVRCYDGSLVPPQLLSRFRREMARLALAKQQYDELQETFEEELSEPVQVRIGQLQRVKSVGPNKRMRRIMIVAVARRLVIALWRYLEQGVIPTGAMLKAG